MSTHSTSTVPLSEGRTIAYHFGQVSEFVGTQHVVLLAMISAALLKTSVLSLSRRSAARCVVRIPPTRIRAQVRFFSDPTVFKPKAPESLTAEVAEGIVETTKFYCLHGVSKQRLRVLAKEDLSIQQRWSKMMEIYLQTQAHVIAGLGYQPNEGGLEVFAMHLQDCLSKTDLTMRELFMDIRRETWHDIVATTFNLESDEIPILSIVDARNIMHKATSKMIEPDTLLAIQRRTAKIHNESKDMEMAQRHVALQEVLIEKVYMDGLLEEEGFGTGEKAYAKMQCALTDHEGDPLITQYSSSAMVKILEAAGIDFNELMSTFAPNSNTQQSGAP